MTPGESMTRGKSLATFTLEVGIEAGGRGQKHMTAGESLTMDTCMSTFSCEVGINAQTLVNGVKLVDGCQLA